VTKNQRRWERFTGTLTVQIAGDGTQRFGTIYEISMGGAFMEVSPLPAVGAVIKVRITRGGRAHHLAAEVRYYVSGIDGPRGLEGVGIAWRDLAPAERMLMEELVARAQSGKPLRGDT
jgi:hypothetical protein